MKVNIDKERILGAIAVLENHLDGAIPDFEDGQVDNVDFIADCIYVHKLLELVATNGISAITGDEYEERFNKARKALNK